MKKAALWLADMVGEGEIFTKDDLRDAFPGVSQIDRRVRDLRDHGWVISTRSEDPELELDEQRLVTIGGRVWDAEYKSPIKREVATPKQRYDALEASDYRCLTCGIAAGDPFLDDPLTVAKLTAVGSHELGWVAACQRCSKGGAKPTSADAFTQAYSILSSAEKRTLGAWSSAGRREPTPLDRAWDLFKRLSGDEQPQALHLMRAEIGSRRGRHSA